MMIRVLLATLWVSLLALPGGVWAEESSEYFSADGAFRVPLRISDNSGADRDAWPVTSGIPLPAGVVMDTASIAIVDESGRQLPAQFASLSRYAARDNSVRWLLMDFQVSIAANSSRQVFLTNTRQQAARAQASAAGYRPLEVSERDGLVSVDTGPLQATVSARDGRIFERVVIAGEQIIGREQAGGSYVRSQAVERFLHFFGDSWNTHGWERETQEVLRRLREENYSGSNASAELVIEDQGPLRTTLRIRGRHMPSAPGVDVVEDGLYNYTLRLHFFAGKSFVKVQLDIENAATRQPQWNFPFREAGLLQGLAMQSGSVATAAFLDSVGGRVQFASVNLLPGNAVRLHQDEPVAARRGQDASRLSRARLASLQDGGGKNIIASGKVARFLDISDARKGLALGIRYFWQEGPRAIEVNERGVRLEVLADKAGGAAAQRIDSYDLDFGQRYINDVLLFFHPRDVTHAEMLAVTEAFEYPLFAVAPPDWYADSEAWYFEVARSGRAGSRSTKENAHWIVTDPADEFRRKRTSYNSGGHHASMGSSWLPFVLSGSASEFERLEVASRWHIARNPGWAYRDNVVRVNPGAENLEEIGSSLMQWDRLAGFGPKDFYLWRSSAVNDRRRGGQSYLNQYKQLPDMEHYANFILFEYYYLSGDRRALDSIHGFVNWALNFQHRHLLAREMRPLSSHDYFERDPEAMWRGHYARVYSWMLYSTVAGFHATDSPVMGYFAIWQIRRALALLRDRHGQFTSPQVEPGPLLAVLPDELRQKVAAHFDLPLFRRQEEVAGSRAKSWMEAQNALALHEAYKTWQDERILDALWGMADYFAHHVLFYPRLGAFTTLTGMPTPRLTGMEMLAPQLHDHHIQALPVLFHYTGWADLELRHRRVKEVTSGRRIGLTFSQLRSWEENTRGKASSRAPERITDLRVVEVKDDRFTLSWTSPRDDGADGRASRYFVKVSDKPIVEFAPTDNPARVAEKARIVGGVERQIIASKGYAPGKLYYPVRGISFDPEAALERLADSDWHRVNAFWMAEHVVGEPAPKPAGEQESFEVKELNLHSWFGDQAKAGLKDMQSDRLFVAVCAWDADRNLGRMSNVVEVRLH